AALTRRCGEEIAMRLDIIVPVMMCCALRWWFGQGMSGTRRAVVTAVTLAVIVGILWFERGFN
ncbi:MAG: hypothetical protein WBA48_16825, partial [Xanthobacteraceae bacterium]